MNVFTDVLVESWWVTNQMLLLLRKDGISFRIGHFLALWLWIVLQPLWPFFSFSHQKNAESKVLSRPGKTAFLKSSRWRNLKKACGWHQCQWPGFVLSLRHNHKPQWRKGSWDRSVPFFATCCKSIIISELKIKSRKSS